MAFLTPCGVDMENRLMRPNGTFEDTLDWFLAHARLELINPDRVEKEVTAVLVKVVDTLLLQSESKTSPQMREELLKAKACLGKISEFLAWRAPRSPDRRINSIWEEERTNSIWEEELVRCKSQIFMSCLKGGGIREEEKHDVHFFRSVYYLLEVVSKKGRELGRWTECIGWVFIHANNAVLPDDELPASMVRIALSSRSQD